MDKKSKRDEIVRQAFQVFYSKGFHATGVDTVLADTGISKRTLYKYFRSKEELIEAAVVYYHRMTLEVVVAELERRAPDAKKKLLTIFDLRREVLENGDFSGCFAINAKLEYKGKHPEIESACSAYLGQLENYIAALCEEAGCKRAPFVARQIMILLEGTIVYGQTKHDPSIATAAKEIAITLINEATTRKGL